MGEPTLPGMPEPPPTTYAPPSSAGRAVRMHSAKLCSQCCRDIHELGVAKAPYPQVARWRVTDAGAVWHLCERHKNERCS